MLRQEEVTKSFDPGIQALYETLKILRLIGRREEAVEAHWLQVFEAPTVLRRGILLDQKTAF